MPDAIKCPACADETKQERIENVALDKKTVRPEPLAIYRCGACDLLYTVPRLTDRHGADAP
jgi:rubredoxin